MLLLVTIVIQISAASRLPNRVRLVRGVHAYREYQARRSLAIDLLIGIARKFENGGIGVRHEC